MILGILGGMGPAATCNLFKKIVKSTNVIKDQDHIHIIIDNNTQIPDRTNYICSSGMDPRPEMIRSIIKLETMGASYIAIPCNTAHYFYEDLVKFTRSRILNMIYETAIFLKNRNRITRNIYFWLHQGHINRKFTKEYLKSLI